MYTWKIYTGSFVKNSNLILQVLINEKILFSLLLSEVEESVIHYRRRAATAPWPGRRISRPVGGHAGCCHGSVASLRAAEAGDGARQGGNTPTFQE